MRLPLPLAAAGHGSTDARTSYPRVWSYKLTTHRYANEHAAVNMCCWLDRQVAAADDSQFDLRIAVGTYQQDRSDSSSSSGGDGVWVCSRASQLETAVLEALQQQESAGATAASLCAVLQRLPDLLLQDIHPAGRMADYIRWVCQQ